MNKFIRMFLATSCLAALVVLTAAARENAAADKPAAKGSIRPIGKVTPADRPALAKISFESALKAALAKVPGGVIKAELEVEDGCLMYSFEIVGPDKTITEVEIDAGNGQVLGTENETGEKEQEGHND
jgi:uncharacterized membrane protein YkoI